MTAPKAEEPEPKSEEPEPEEAEAEAPEPVQTAAPEATPNPIWKRREASFRYTSAPVRAVRPRTDAPKNA